MWGLLVLIAVGALLGAVILTAMVVADVRRPPRHTAGWAIARGVPCDPSELALAHEAWTLDATCGAIPVWEISTDRGEPDAPTAVIVHGWGQSRIDMLVRRAPFDECCARTILYELRGHGESPVRSSALGRGEENDLCALVDHLGAVPVILVGHGLGAAIAIAAAARLGDRVAGVVAFGASTDHLAAVRRGHAPARRVARPWLDLALAWCATRGLRPPPVLDAAQRLRSPLLVVHADADAIAPVEDAEAIASAAPNGQIVHVTGAPHLDHRALDAVRDFIVSLGARTRRDEKLYHPR